MTESKITKSKIKSAIQNVGRWHALAASYESDEILKKTAALRDELEQILEGLGHKPEKKAVRVRKGESF